MLEIVVENSLTVIIATPLVIIMAVYLISRYVKNRINAEKIFHGSILSSVILVILISTSIGHTVNTAIFSAFLISLAGFRSRRLYAHGSIILTIAMLLFYRGEFDKQTTLIFFLSLCAGFLAIEENNKKSCLFKGLFVPFVPHSIATIILVIDTNGSPRIMDHASEGYLGAYLYVVSVLGYFLNLAIHSIYSDYLEKMDARSLDQKNPHVASEKRLSSYLFEEIFSCMDAVNTLSLKDNSFFQNQINACSVALYDFGKTGNEFVLNTYGNPMASVEAVLRGFAASGFDVKIQTDFSGPINYVGYGDYRRLQAFIFMSIYAAIRSPLRPDSDICIYVSAHRVAPYEMIIDTCVSVECGSDNPYEGMADDDNKNACLDLKSMVMTILDILKLNASSGDAYSILTDDNGYLLRSNASSRFFVSKDQGEISMIRRLNGRVLLVISDVARLAFVHGILIDLANEVCVARDGIDVSSRILIDREKFDLIIMDRNVQFIKPTEIIDAMRRSQSYSDLPTIIGLRSNAMDDDKFWESSGITLVAGISAGAHEIYRLLSSMTFTEKAKSAFRGSEEKGNIGVSSACLKIAELRNVFSPDFILRTLSELERDIMASIYSLRYRCDAGSPSGRAQIELELQNLNGFLKKLDILPEMAGLHIIKEKVIRGENIDTEVFVLSKKIDSAFTVIRSAVVQ